MSALVQHWLPVAWNQCWQVTCVALAALLAVRFGCRARPHMAYALCMLVLAKALTPPIWSSPTSVFSWIGSKPERAATLDNDVSPRSEMPLLPAPANASPASETPRSRQVAHSAALPPPPLPYVPWPMLIALVWMAGFLGCVALLASHRLVLWHRLSNSFTADAEIMALVAKLRQRLGIDTAVRVLLTEESFGPALVGWWRPTIVLPQALVSHSLLGRLEYVLAHELIHVRRGDAVAASFQLAAQATWWFHPLVWWVAHEATRQRERACDEELLAALGCDPGDYAQALLDVLKLKRSLRPLFALAAVGSGHITRQRLEHIMNPHVAFHARMPRRYWLLIVCGAALVIPGRGISRASTPDRSNYLQQPYSEEAFSALMKLQNQQPTADMESWKISGVFRAERQDQPQLTVVAIDRDASTPGCIVVLGPHGEHLRTLRDEAVNLRLLVRNCEPSVVERERDVQRSVELVASSELESVREKLKREEVVQLVDLNGDGSAEIPTRGSFVKRLGNLEAVFEFESVYLTADESIPRRFRIEFNPLAADEVRGPTGSWENCHLARAGDGALAALGTLSQPVIPVREITVTRADGRVEQREEAATRDFSQPPRTLATFRWSDEQRTFVGPQHGPARLWLVVAP